MRIVVGEGSCGIAAGAHKVYEAISALGVTPRNNGLYRYVLFGAYS